MRSRAERDPFQFLGYSERREWRQTEREVQRTHDEEQMQALRGMAATGRGVTRLTTADPGAPFQCSPVEMIIDGRRLRAARVSRRALAALRDGLTNIAAVPLTAVGRYGPYWVLTFKVATEQLVVLAEHLTLMPDWGGPAGRGAPAGPRVRLAI